MKKIMAIALAIVMMMAIAVPAFAEAAGKIEYNDGTGAGSKTTITTLLETEDGLDPTWYTVSIPTTQTIFWEADSTDVKYTISSQLATANRVEVTVADADGEYAMTNAAIEGVELAYSLVDATYTSSAPVIDGEEAIVKIDTSAAEWAKAPVDAYSDILTFTAKVV